MTSTVPHAFAGSRRGLEEFNRHAPPPNSARRDPRARSSRPRPTRTTARASRSEWGRDAAAARIEDAVHPTSLARTSHQLSTTAGDAPHPTGFSQLRMLDVLSSTPPRSSNRKPSCSQHLASLATIPGEICRLVRYTGVARVGRQPIGSHGHPYRSIIDSKSRVFDIDQLR